MFLIPTMNILEKLSELNLQKTLPLRWKFINDLRLDCTILTEKDTSYFLTKL